MKPSINPNVKELHNWKKIENAMKKKIENASQEEILEANGWIEGYEEGYIKAKEEFNKKLELLKKWIEDVQHFKWSNIKSDLKKKIEEIK